MHSICVSHNMSNTKSRRCNLQHLMLWSIHSQIIGAPITHISHGLHNMSNHTLVVHNIQTRTCIASKEGRPPKLRRSIAWYLLQSTYFPSWEGQASNQKIEGKEKKCNRESNMWVYKAHTLSPVVTYPNHIYLGRPLAQRLPT